MNLPKTTFISSPETEVDRILFISDSITCGFYKDKGFCVLPKLVGKYKAAQIILPNLDYAKIKDYWRNVDETEYCNLLRDEDLKKQLKKLVGERKVSRKIVSDRLKEWKKIENKFWDFAYFLFPSETRLISQLEVRITDFGSTSSYVLCKSKKGGKWIVYLRSDASLSHLAEILLTMMVRNSEKYKYLGWRQTEGLTDFFMTHEKMEKLFVGYRPTMLDLVRVDSNLKKKSSEYLSNLKVVYRDRQLQVHEDLLYFKGKSIENALSSQEKALMLKLYSRSGELVSFDEVADVLWGEGEYVSLWALNKAVQRLRKKLETVGLSENMLKTVRKRGYVFEAN
ncbi:transcriptional regulator [Patescibacteria group bacterium]